MNKDGDELNVKESCNELETQLADDFKSFLNVDVSKQVHKHVLTVTILKYEIWNTVNT